MGWPFQNSPYGPLFTLSSYAIAPLGLAGGLWALKTLAVATSLAAIALLSKAAGREALSADVRTERPGGLRTALDRGRAARFTAAFVGLNPVLLELAVGGDHNPIHTNPVGAKLFGFPTVIAHGMFSAAAVLANLEAAIPDAVTYSVRFGKPVLLPASAGLYVQQVQDGWDISLRNIAKGYPHLTGTLRAH